MQLDESRGREGADHHLGLLRRLLGGEALPGVGAEVVAGEDDALGGEAVLVGDPLDEVAEVLRGHARITAILVDLVAGSLDQQRRLVGSVARIDASSTMGCAEQTEGMPDGRARSSHVARSCSGFWVMASTFRLPKQGIEFISGGGALHRADLGDRIGAGGIGIAKRGFGRSA